MRAIDAINRMREALRDIEGRAAFALAHQDEDEDANRSYLTTVLVGVESRARSATWGEAVP